MLPGERLDLIRALAAALWELPYRQEVDDILDEFGFPVALGGTDEGWDSYVRRILRGGTEDALLSLGSYLEVEGPGLVRTEQRANADSGDPATELRPPERFRVFLSHISQEKTYVADVKQQLERYQVSAFVAHEDIEPTREWVLEIERALQTCQALVAFLHPGFDRSRWTDQEVGFAVGRGIPIIGIRLGLDPYGFIGRYQALPGNLDAETLAQKIFMLLMQHPATIAAIGDSVVAMMEEASSFQDAKKKVPLLRAYGGWTPDLLDRLEASIDGNRQVGEATGVPEAIRTLVAEKR